jgi:hypothetical protein
MKIFSNFVSDSDPIYDNLKKLDKPITFFYDYIPQSFEQLNLNPYNFIFLQEPNELFGMHTWVKNNHNLFTGILTWGKDVLDNCNNAVLFYHSCNYLEDNYINSFKNKNKTFEVSFLSGAKNLVEGHRLRQNIFLIKDLINIPKKWFYTLSDFNQEDFNNGGIGRPNDFWNNKKICFNESMFHVCVENTKQHNWFTEKISDAFTTKTVPIYWGCPNLSDFGYDERGIIRFESPEELLYIINNLTEEKYYEMKSFVDYNYEIAKAELKFKSKLENFFLEFCALNNI